MEDRMDHLMEIIRKLEAETQELKEKLYRKEEEAAELRLALSEAEAEMEQSC